jgi:hypothetical protein
MSRSQWRQCRWRFGRVQATLGLAKDSENIRIGSETLTATGRTIARTAEAIVSAGAD